MQLTSFMSLALGLALAGAAGAQQTVTIGHAGPISGPSAHLGKGTENGARMAVEELNARGVTLNGKKVTLALLAEDDAADPKQGTAVAQKLVDAGVKGVIGHLNSGTTVPASKIYFDAGIAQISPSTTSPLYTRQGFNTAFRVVANDNMLGAALGGYAVATLAAHRIAVIDDRSAYGQGVADEFIKGAKGKSATLRIVAREFTNVNATDFTAILTTIKAKGADLIFFGGMDAVAGPMLRQVKALGMHVRFMGGDGLCTDMLATLSGDSLGEGNIVCAEAGGIDAAQQAQLENFQARYRKRFNSPAQVYSPYAYDALMMMVAAMRQAGSAEPGVYLPVLAKIRHVGVTGPLAFDARGDLKNAALTLYTYKGGKKTRLAVLK